jgi:hypothetical protein
MRHETASPFHEVLPTSRSRSPTFPSPPQANSKLQTPSLGTDGAGHTQHDTATDNLAGQAPDSHPADQQPHSQADHDKARLSLMRPQINTVGIRQTCRGAVPDTCPRQMLGASLAALLQFGASSGFGKPSPLKRAAPLSVDSLWDCPGWLRPDCPRYGTSPGEASMRQLSKIIVSGSSAKVTPRVRTSRHTLACNRSPAGHNGTPRSADARPISVHT